jgi:hypothetical protein
MNKQWYLSKTLWVNLIALIALVLQSQFGFIIDAESQMALLLVINLVLRAITGDEIVFGNKSFRK